MIKKVNQKASEGVMHKFAIKKNNCKIYIGFLGCLTLFPRNSEHGNQFYYMNIVNLGWVNLFFESVV